jgi:hypothetical protein
MRDESPQRQESWYSPPPLSGSPQFSSSFGDSFNLMKQHQPASPPLDRSIDRDMDAMSQSDADSTAGTAGELRQPMDVEPSGGDFMMLPDDDPPPRDDLQ